MNRRTVLGLFAALPIPLWLSDANAGTYLNRAALLLNGSRAARQMALPRSRDKELMGMLHKVAVARVHVVNHMKIPKVIQPAHPHLQLVMEGCERGYAAALDDDYNKFVEHLLRSRKEGLTFRKIVKKLGYSVPNTC